MPITSRLKPKSKAMGNAIRVPKSSKSCKINAGPTWKMEAIDWPMEMANLASKIPWVKPLFPPLI